MKLILIIFSLFFSACGVSLVVAGTKLVDTTEENKAESYSYCHDFNGCKTGEKKFSSKDVFCAGLRDDAANNYCARELRYEQFKQECPGKTW